MFADYSCTQHNLMQLEAAVRSSGYTLFQYRHFAAQPPLSGRFTAIVSAATQQRNKTLGFKLPFGSVGFFSSVLIASHVFSRLPLCGFIQPLSLRLQLSFNPKRQSLQKARQILT
jgi:hypothetical protein